MQDTVDDMKGNGGDGVAILVEETFSPTRDRLRAELTKTFPKLTWALYDPLRPFNEIEATRAAFGEGVRLHPRFDRADVILSLDSDFLYLDEGGVESTRDYANRRRVASAKRLDEPAVRRRESFHDHRRQGRPPPALPGQPDRRARRGHCEEDRR